MYAVTREVTSPTVALGRTATRAPSRAALERPPRAPATVTPVACHAPSASPRTAIDAVSRLRTRRGRKSIVAAAPPHSATAARSNGSDTACGDGLPEHRVDRVADGIHS